LTFISRNVLAKRRDGSAFNALARHERDETTIFIRSKPRSQRAINAIPNLAYERAVLQLLLVSNVMQVKPAIGVTLRLVNGWI
jgi:hypothetical protein